MSEYTPPKDIAEIVDAVNNRDPDVSIVDAIGMARKLGFLSIGTAQSEPVHKPIADQVYSDRRLGYKVYVEDPGIPVLQVTWSGKIAVMCGVLGDINIPGQRRQLGTALTPKECLYGWFNTTPGLYAEQYGREDFIGVQAATQLLTAVRRKHDAITGVIDLVAMDGGDFYFVDEKPEPDELHTLTRPGIVLTRTEQTTVATLAVFGSDLWATGIVPPTEVRP